MPTAARRPVLGCTLAATVLLMLLLRSLLLSFPFPFTVALLCALACCLAVKVDELTHPPPKINGTLLECAKLGLSWTGALLFMFISLVRNVIVSYKLVNILRAPAALLLDCLVCKTPIRRLPAFALLHLLLGIAATMGNDLELTAAEASYAIAAAFIAALNETWIRHADWMRCLSEFEGLRVVAPWAVVSLLVPALSEASAVWSHVWKVRDVASLVAACALFVAVSWCGIFGAKRFSAMESQMIGNAASWFLSIASIVWPIHRSDNPIDPVLQPIGVGCAGAAILLYFAAESHARKRGPAHASGLELGEDAEVPPPPRQRESFPKYILPAAAAMVVLTWSLHGISVMRAETQASIDSRPSGSTSAPPPLAVLLEPPKPEAVPLCLIATWSGPKFPAISQAFIKSFAPSGRQVRLNLFVDGAVPRDLPNSTVAPYLQVVTLESIDSSYATRQWAGFISDRICTYLGSSAGSAACNATEAALDMAAARDPGHPPIMQFRGVYGRLFEEWIGPGHCDSWGWLDTDMLLGDVAGWLADSPEYRDADVATFSNLYKYAGPLSLYTRGQLTIHNQRRVPRIVNELWRGCKIFESLTSVATVFRDNLAEAVDEGCYSKAVFQSREIVVAVLPWQAADWEGWDYGAFIGGRLFVARGCKDNDAGTDAARFAKCRTLSRTAAARVDPQSRGPALARSSPTPTVVPAALTEPGCLWWVDPNEQTCLTVETPPAVQQLLDAGGAAFAVKADRAANHSLTVFNRQHRTPGDGGGGLAGGFGIIGSVL
ncbi:hypothetical protein BDK51DRAFT_47520 [Blyttiomyces helicus]|uniref:Uncharacterized protein n=1 Tax=Blyttiomyces helicus TaxID=388810 RepID=A0A4P9W4S1_9FUNG|nr:hypothetical protein BDK51DRAFT_47520 [Blyttiomyces helicus]|eukprot:RKO85868.1 hypothetical protein BDK51DRAFT_47520 [Blyttiomyces helicus]